MHHEQSSDEVGEFALRLLDLFCSFGCQVFCVHHERGGFCASFHDFRQRFVFVRGVALHGVHKVRDEVSASLILTLEVAPRRVDSFFFGDETVVGRERAEHEHHDDRTEENQRDGSFGNGFRHMKE